MTYREQGPVPTETLDRLESDVHHLDRSVHEDRAYYRAQFDKIDERLREVEAHVSGLRHAGKIWATIFSGSVIAGFGAVLALLLSRR